MEGIMTKVSPLLYIGLPDKKQFMVRSGRKETDPEVIIEAICACLKISRIDMMSKSRKGELTEARCIAIGLILEANPKHTLKSLGEMFGGRDHSTVIYNRDTFNNLYERDKPFTKKVKEVLKYV